MVPFDRTFRGEATEISSRELDRRLQSPAELSGALNKALKALVAINERGISQPLSLITAQENFRRATDPLAVWLGEATIAAPGTSTPKALLLQAYNRHAIHHDMPTMTAQAMGRAVKRTQPRVQDGQRLVGGIRAEVWVGIGLLDTVHGTR